MQDVIFTFSELCKSDYKLQVDIQCYIDWYILQVSSYVIYFLNFKTFKVDFIIDLQKVPEALGNAVTIVIDRAIHEDIYIHIHNGHKDLLKKPSELNTIRVYKLNIMKDLPSYIPRNLLARENLLTLYQPMVE